MQAIGQKTAKELKLQASGPVSLQNTMIFSDLFRIQNFSVEDECDGKMQT